MTHPDFLGWEKDSGSRYFEENENAEHAFCFVTLGELIFVQQQVWGGGFSWVLNSCQLAKKLCCSTCLKFIFLILPAGSVIEHE